MTMSEQIRQGIIGAASELGINPADLATAISFETAGTFNPVKAGPTTKWGQHKGLIQFGEPQAKAFGADFSSDEAAVKSQLGKDGAIVKYLRNAGVKSGMGLLDVYSAINAGSVGRYDASDTAAGGTAGTVRDKVRDQMVGHAQKAEALLGGEYTVDMSGSGGSGASIGGGSGEDQLQKYSPAAQSAMYNAYLSGDMSSEEMAAYKSAIVSGAVSVPQGVEVQRKYSPAAEQKMFDAFSSGDMSDEEKDAYQFGVSMGEIGQPEAVAFDAPEIPQSQISDVITPPRVEVAEAAPVVEQGADGFDLTRKFAREAGGETFGQAMRGEAVQLPRALDAIGLQDVANLGVAGLSGMGALMGGAAGLAGDVVQGLGDVQGGERLARDLAAMPEALAGSPFALARGASVPRSTPVRPITSRAPEAPLSTVDDMARLSQAEQETMGDLISKATRGDKKALDKIVEGAKVDMEAMKAAEEAGINVPADVFADNTLIKQSAMSIRAAKGSDAAADWENTTTAAARRAKDIMAEAGSSGDISVASERVRLQLSQSMDDLRDAARPLYAEVEAAIPPSSQVQPSNLVNYMQDRIQSLGGNASLMTPQEKRLFKMVSDPDNPSISYGALREVRENLGQAMREKTGVYKELPEIRKGELYDAILQDEIANTRRIAGDDVASKLVDAKRMWAESKDLEKSLVAGFGRNNDGSIAKKLDAAIKSGAKGDVKALRDVMRIVPESLRSEVATTALDNAMSGPRGDFGIQQFASAFKGLRSNSEVYSELRKSVGPEKMAQLDQLYVALAPVARAMDRIRGTGADNQALVRAANADRLALRFVNSQIGRGVRAAVGAGVGTATAGPYGAIIGGGLGSAKIGSKKASAAHELFKSDEFQNLIIQAAKQDAIPQKSMRHFQNSVKFKKWAAQAGIKNPQAWLLAAVSDQDYEESSE